MVLVSGQGAGGGICWMDDKSCASYKKHTSTLQPYNLKEAGWIYLVVDITTGAVTLAFWASKSWIRMLRLAAAERLSV